MPSPLFEFDSERQAFLEPARRFPQAALPPLGLLHFLPKAQEALLRRQPLPELLRLETFGLGIPVYGLERGGQTMALAGLPYGAPVAAALLEELIARGLSRFVLCGGAGALQPLPAGELLLPSAALRDEGSSHHYLPAALEVEPDAGLLAELEKRLAARGIPFRKGKTWTTDGLYRETPERIRRRREAGALCVEMEAAACFAVARFRGVAAAALLCAGDDLSGEAWAHRGWDRQLSVHENMLEIAAEGLATSRNSL